MAAPGPGTGHRADGESLLRSRKRNFSEAEVSALLRCVSARRKKLMAAPQDKVPLWQRTQIWKQVTEAVNAASGFRNRRTPGEVKKKWSDIKIEAKKRLRVATERGDDAELRPTDKRILAILQQDPDPVQDCTIDLDPDPEPDLSVVKQEPGLEPGLDSALPTIVNVTTVKSEPLLSESDPNSSSTSASMDHAQINPFMDRAPINTFMDRAPINTFSERAQINTFTENFPPVNHITERAQMNPFTESFPHINHITEQAKTGPFTERSQPEAVTEHAQTNHVSESAQFSQPNLMLLLLQNQQQILDTLRNMAQTFSQINSSLKDISQSLKNR